MRRLGREFAVSFVAGLAAAAGEKLATYIEEKLKERRNGKQGREARKAKARRRGGDD